MSEHSTQLAIIITCPPETMEKMVGESIFDGGGNPIGWIANDVHRPDEQDALKLHERMNAVLLGINDELLALHTRDRENASSKELIDCVIAAHQIIDDAATVGVGTCELINAADDLGKGTSSFMCFKCGYTALDDWWDEFNYCPSCGSRIIEEVTE